MHACYKNINVKDTTQILKSPLSKKFHKLSEKLKTSINISVKQI